MFVIETPSPIVAPLVTGCFEHGASYRTTRSKGTSDWLLICTLDGQGIVKTEHQTFLSSAKSIQLFPPGTPHDYSTAIPNEDSPPFWQFDWAHFIALDHWARWLEPSSVVGNVSNVRFSNAADFQIAANAIRCAHIWAISAHPAAKNLAMNCIEQALIVCSLELSSNQTHLDPRIRRVVDTVLSDLDDHWPLDKMAKIASLSASRFTHLFRESMGTTPQHFVESRRIERARQLLTLTDMPVWKIALEVGFESPFYMSNRFKSLVGVSPAKYRQSNLHSRHISK